MRGPLPKSAGVAQRGGEANIFDARVGYGSLTRRRGIDDGRPEPVAFDDEFPLFLLDQDADAGEMPLLDVRLRRTDDFRPTTLAGLAVAPVGVLVPLMPARADREPIGACGGLQPNLVPVSH